MAASTSSACFFTHQYIHGSHHQPFNQAPGDPESALSSTSSSSMAVDEHLNSLLSNVSVLKNKVNEVQSMATSVFIHQPHLPPSETLAGLESLIQEITVTASGMLFHCQQMAVKPPPSTATATATTTGNNPLLPVAYSNYNDMQDRSVQSYTSNGFKKPVVNNVDPCNGLGNREPKGGIQVGNFVTNEAFYWYSGNDDKYNHNSNNNNNSENGNGVVVVGRVEAENHDIIEINAADLLAKYTHYCQVCGKGFKRDSNLRMHMRAHGDEYKSSAALSNPTKNSSIDATGAKKYYSCPQEGCRWNKKHAKFQPLKSMICAKNHYKRSHCPKLYICKRCNIKQFAVPSDLRTHEKHCGDLKWQCSCGTTFSRKDKLMGHVALSVGHTPIVVPTGATGRG